AADGARCWSWPTSPFQSSTRRGGARTASTSGGKAGRARFRSLRRARKAASPSGDVGVAEWALHEPTSDYTFQQGSAWYRAARSRRPGAGSDFDQAFADRVEHGLRAIVDVQLLVHVADVVADRLLADLQLVGDLLVGHAARQQLQDLDLAAGQPVVEL